MAKGSIGFFQIYGQKCSISLELDFTPNWSNQLNQLIQNQWFYKAEELMKPYIVPEWHFTYQIEIIIQFQVSYSSHCDLCEIKTDFVSLNDLNCSERELYELKEFEEAVSVFPLDPHTTYTAMVVAMLAPGVTRQFTIPNIVAGKEINMAAYQSSYFVLSPAVIMSLLVIIIVSIIIIAVSIIVFLMSQTW